MPATSRDSQTPFPPLPEGLPPPQWTSPSLELTAARLLLHRPHRSVLGEHVFGILSTLDSLTSLDLSDNFLNGPLSELATKLVHLEALYLDSNQISALPKSLGAWTKMKWFSASDNQIAVLPPEVGEWRNSVFISLRTNLLKELPTEVGNWVHLERLFLGTNLLTAIPHEFGSLTALVELELRNNQIAELPMTLSACVQLRRLHLGKNKIVEIPSEILSTLTELEELHLYDNRLESLPPEVGCLTKCHRMTLSSNNLRTLPEEVAQCSSLTELYINKNAKFGSLPGSVGQLRALKEIQARNCPALKSLPSSASDWSNLEVLDLSMPKKSVCKLAPEFITAAEATNCRIIGGIQKKAGKGKKKK